jgi:FkbH-like protein
VEREKVRTALPEVTVIEVPDAPLQFAKLVRDCPELQRLRLSAEDGKRTQLYAEQREREAMKQNTGSLEDFFRSLEQQIEIASVDAVSLARVAQLTQKTNQFNATTRRYNEQEVAERGQNGSWDVFSIRAGDRFGDNGIVGVVMVKREGDRSTIDTMLLSCRVLGRTIETAILAFLAERYRGEGMRTLTGEIVMTPKNGPVRDLYQRHGFGAAGTQESATRWELDLTAATIEPPEWIQVRTNVQQPIHEFTR